MAGLQSPVSAASMNLIQWVKNKIWRWEGGCLRGGWASGQGTRGRYGYVYMCEITNQPIKNKKHSMGLSSLWKHYHQFHMSPHQDTLPFFPMSAFSQTWHLQTWEHALLWKPAGSGPLDRPSGRPTVRLLASCQPTAKLSTQLACTRGLQLNLPLSLPLDASLFCLSYPCNSLLGLSCQREWFCSGVTFFCSRFPDLFASALWFCYFCPRVITFIFCLRASP